MTAEPADHAKSERFMAMVDAYTNMSAEEPGTHAHEVALVRFEEASGALSDAEREAFAQFRENYLERVRREGDRRDDAPST